MDTALLTSAYLAPIQYYTKLFRHPLCLTEQHDHYIKQTYRNRCVIATADGPLALTVPVTLRPEGKTPMYDVRISDHGNWRHLHWNALVSAYENSPYFEYYADDLRPFYEERYLFLADFNEALQNKVCELLNLHPQCRRTEAYMQPTPDTVDFRETIHPKRDYRDDNTFTPCRYYQVFEQRHGFLPNLSIADLLFNMGPEGLITLRNSCLSE